MQAQIGPICNLIYREVIEVAQKNKSLAPHQSLPIDTYSSERHIYKFSLSPKLGCERFSSMQIQEYLIHHPSIALYSVGFYCTYLQNTSQFPFSFLDSLYHHRSLLLFLFLLNLSLSLSRTHSLDLCVNMFPLQLGFVLSIDYRNVGVRFW